MATAYGPSIVRDGLVLALDAANPKSILNTVEVLVVAGGGGGGTGGGGGAGGLLYSSSYSVAPGTAITVTIGGGGAGNSAWGGSGANGSNSVFGALTAIGGGAGQHRAGSASSGTGGSGGGGAGGSGVSNGVTLVMTNGTAGQGFAGGSSTCNGTTQEEPGGGGGGAGGKGADSIIPANTTNAAANSALPGAGGVGLAYNISGTLTYYAGGGGGSNRNGVGASGGLGGGGAGGTSPVAGTANTGGGGGGTGYAGYGGGGTSAAGGSGIVIVRYFGPARATGGTITTVGGYTIHTFTTVGSTTFTPNATWSDLTLSGFNGTLTTSPTYDSTNGGSFSFDGTSNYVNVGNVLSYNTIGQQLTISVWIYPTRSSNYILGRGTSNANYGHFSLFMDTGAVKFSYYNTVSGYGTYTIGNISNNVWSHIFISHTFGSSSSTISAINGVQIGSWVSGGSAVSDYVSGTSFEIAHWYGTPTGTSTAYWFQGKISLVQIYNRSLTLNEGQQNFNALRGRYGV
jgi:hypothetical protein